MVAEPRTISIDTDSELGLALDEANGEPIVLIRGRARFRVVPDEVPAPLNRSGIWANYDPDGIREGLREIVGVVTPEEGERMKELIYRGREEGTRPIDRP